MNLVDFAKSPQTGVGEGGAVHHLHPCSCPLRLAASLGMRQGDLLMIDSCPFGRVGRWKEAAQSLGHPLRLNCRSSHGGKETLHRLSERVVHCCQGTLLERAEGAACWVVPSQRLLSTR